MSVGFRFRNPGKRHSSCVSLRQRCLLQIRPGRVDGEAAGRRRQGSGGRDEAAGGQVAPHGRPAPAGQQARAAEGQGAAAARARIHLPPHGRVPVQAEPHERRARGHKDHKRRPARVQGKTPHRTINC
eukprot:scaffold173870_cov27-Prasinocladus_malaysianus.AAC.1